MSIIIISIVIIIIIIIYADRPGGAPPRVGGGQAEPHLAHLAPAAGAREEAEPQPVQARRVDPLLRSAQVRAYDDRASC